MIDKKISEGKAKIKILFADNNSEFLDTRAEFLNKAGFDVLKANNLEDAILYLNHARIHLAILDVRMENDDLEQDISGLVVAKDPAYQHIPKLILTGFPSTDKVREVLRIQPYGSPAAWDFLTKEDGPEVMITSISNILEQHLKINWGLQIYTIEQGPVNFAYRASLLSYKQEVRDLHELGAELEDLFRKLFYDYNQITLGRIIWQREQRAALEVFAFAEASVESFVLTYGNSRAAKDELEIYNEKIKKNETSTITNPALIAETQRFAAIAWKLLQVNVDETLNFSDFYYRNSERQVRLAIENLYQFTLDVWYQQDHKIKVEKDLSLIMRENLGISPEILPPESFRYRIHDLVNEAVKLRIANISMTSENLEFHLTGSNKLTYPDLTQFIYGNEIFHKTDISYVTTPGIHELDTVLVDSNCQSWLTDFAQIQDAPIWQDFVSLETSIRFELLGVYDHLIFLDFEEQLLNTSRLDEKIRLSDVVPECRKGLSAIQTIRQTAAHVAGNDLLSYYIALLFYSAQSLIIYDPEIRQTKREITSLVHRLLFSVMLCKKISELQENPISESIPLEKLRLRLDTNNQRVWVGEKEVNLTQTEFELLYYLFRNANQLCTREDILKEIFQYENATKKTGASLINTTISRLRDKIEPYPGKQIFIQTKRGQGYTLYPEPE